MEDKTNKPLELPLKFGSTFTPDAYVQFEYPEIAPVTRSELIRAVFCIGSLIGYSMIFFGIIGLIIMLISK